MFKRIHIEISNICNVQCSFCPIVLRPKEIMSKNQFEHILVQALPHTEDICLHLMGEPLAHPEFEEILNISEDKKASIQITTNGLLIERYAELILNKKSVRQINFSLQAFQDNFPEKPIESYLNPIFKFTEAALFQRPELYINFRLWNFGDESFLKNENLIIEVEKRFNARIKREVEPSGIKSKKVLKDKRLYLHFDSRFDWPSAQFPKRTEKGTCYGMRNHIGIHADGTVVPCCLDKEATLNLGNCLKQDLKEILSSQRAQKIKHGFEAGHLVEDLCQKCTFIKRFDSKVKAIQN